MTLFSHDGSDPARPAPTDRQRAVGPAGRLLANGFEQVGEDLRMVLPRSGAVPDPRRPLSAPPLGRLRVARHPGPASGPPRLWSSDASLVLAEAFEVDAYRRSALEADLLACAARPDCSVLVVYDGEDPIATARRTTTAEGSYLSSIGTRPGLARARPRLAGDRARRGGRDRVARDGQLFVHLAVDVRNGDARRLYERLDRGHRLAGAGPPGAVSDFPQLRLRRTGALLDLPWELPLADWPAELRFSELPVGPSRHLVRFLASSGGLYAVKEEPLEIAAPRVRGPAPSRGAACRRSTPVGRRRAPADDGRSSSPVPGQLAPVPAPAQRFPLGPGRVRGRLLDAMAWLLVDLHRGGVFWGDCSLANTLFRRDGDRIQAFLVDAETSEVHPLALGRPAPHDLEILVENVGYGLADRGDAPGRPEDVDAAIDRRRERPRSLPRRSGASSTPSRSSHAGDRQAIRAPAAAAERAGLRGRRDRGLEPTDGGSAVRLRVDAANRAFHASELGA